MKWLIHYNNNTCVYWNKELVVLFNSKWKGVLSSHMTSHCTAVHSWACFSTGYFRKVTRISIQSMEQDAWKTQYCSFTTFIKKSCKWRKTAGTTYCRISGDILLIFCRWNKQHLFLSNVGSLNSVQSIKQKIYRIVFIHNWFDWNTSSLQYICQLPLRLVCGTVGLTCHGCIPLLYGSGSPKKS